ncbi:MAG: chemotaxis-specific protein-glutamate methyltransferase CheB [Pseudomonadota bacterium]
MSETPSERQPHLGKPLRVLLVEDSAFMRGAVARLLGADGRFEIVGQARDGTEGVRLALELNPDVISMDYNMPGLNGAAATREILAERAIPIVILSAHTREGEAATIDALRAGAVDFVTKPNGEVSANLSSIRDELVGKLLSAAGVNLAFRLAAPASSAGSRPSSARKVAPVGLKAVVIACSTGGPAALAALIPALRLEHHAALLIVQHMAAGYTRALAAQLAADAPFPVKEAETGVDLQAGSAWVAAGDQHLFLDSRGRLALSEAPLVNGVRPAADVTLASVAEQFGPRSLGVILTGMGKDGARGLAHLKAAGGVTLAQDRASSTVYGMPKAAVELGVVDTVAPLSRMAALINRWVSEG